MPGRRGAPRWRGCPGEGKLRPVTLQVLLLALLAVIVAVAAAAFHLGERGRRGSAGATGPRPVGSVGEALRQVGTLPGGRVLLLVLEAGEAAQEVSRAMAEETGVVEALAHPSLRHVVLRRGEEEQVTAHLFQKYGGLPLPAGQWALLLDREGLPIARADLNQGPLPGWLPRWLDDQPSLGSARPSPSSPPS